MVVGLLVMAATLIGTAGPASAQAGPTVTATPSTDLLDGQTITISGTGASPGQSLYVGQCGPGVTDPFSCDIRSVVTTVVDSNGEYSSEYAVKRFIPAPGGTADCATGGCTVGISNLGDVSVTTPIEFTDVPLPVSVVEVIGNADLVDGDVVELQGSGFPAGYSVNVKQCLAGSTDPSSCGPGRTIGTEAGGFSYPLPVNRILRSGGASSDCSVVDCVFRVTNIGSLPQSASLDFRDPVFDIVISNYGTTDPAGGETVARFELTCDVSTPVSWFGSIAQAGNTFTFRVVNQRCEPGTPLLGWVPIYVQPSYDQGSATVEVEVAPVRLIYLNEPTSAVTAVSEPVQLLDAEAIRAVVSTELADPNNTELIDEVQRAILTRVQQDARFRSFFRQLILGG